MALTQITSGGLDANIDINGNTLKVDGTNNRVGIGTASPSNNLDVLSTTSGATVNARVGSTATSGANNANLIINNGGTGNGTLRFDYESSSNRASIGVPASTKALFFTTDGTERLRIDSSGRVLLGTTTEGEANADDLTVATSGHTGMTIRSGTANRGNIYFSDGTSGDAEYRGYVTYDHDGDKLSFGTANANRILIDSSGNVGIGTASPNKELVITKSNAGGDVGLRIQNNTNTDAGTTASIRFTTSPTATYDTAAIIADRASGSLSFHEGGVERMRIDSSGNVGIGTTAPDSNAKLDVNGSVNISPNTAGKATFRFATNASDDGRLLIKSDTTTKVDIQANGASYFNGGNVGIGTVPSSLNATNGYVLRLNGGSQTFIAFNNSTHTTQTAGGFVIGNDAVSAYIIQRQTQPIKFSTNNAERMQIDSSGRLLVGTTTAGQSDGDDLTIAPVQGGNENSGITIRSGTTRQGSIYFADGTSGVDTYRGFISYKHSDEYMLFGTNNTERMRISSNGNVDIGPVSGPSGTVSNTGFRFMEGNGFWWSTTGANSYWNTSTDTYFNFRRHGSTVGSIVIGSSSTSYNTSSDYRLKENVVDLDGAITRVKQLAPKRFNFIADDTTTVDGFLAHEAQAVVPEAVTGTKDEVDDDGDAVMQGIDQSKLVPLLTAALQEAIAKIETLETKVASLEAG